MVLLKIIKDTTYYLLIIKYRSHVITNVRKTRQSVRITRLRRSKLHIKKNGMHIDYCQQEKNQCYQ